MGVVQSMDWRRERAEGERVVASDSANYSRAFGPLAPRARNALELQDRTADRTPDIPKTI